MTERERICICALQRIFGFEPTIAHNIMENLGSASALFELSSQEVTELFGPFSKYGPKICSAELDAAAQELEYMSRLGIRLLTIEEDGYPPLLKECPDAPVALYVQAESGDTTVFHSRPCIAIVGTRDITPYGREWCRRIVGALAMSTVKPCIVSGLAIGTDICAHEAALEAGLPTIAVLPSGLDEVYPMRHRDFAKRLAELPGCAVISDYPARTGAAKVNFVRRNRIIAGLCKATILTESRQDGGGMITARFAQSYDRDLFVLPGRIDEPGSQGCNMLVRQKLAEPITDLDLLVEALGLGKSSRRRKEDLSAELTARYDGDPSLNDILDIALTIRGHRGIDIPGIVSRTGRQYSDVATICAMLESDGFIQMDLLQRCSINVKIV